MYGLSRLLCIIALAVVAPASSHVEAALDVNLGASVRIGDAADVFLAVSSRYFDENRARVEQLAVRYQNPDDLTVSLFIGNHSGSSQDKIYALRQSGLSWWEISLRFGVPSDVWFVRVKRAPGPPYGKAYGYWKKQGRQGMRTITLSDDDIRNLAAVRLVHDYYQVSAETAMEWRATGRNVAAIVSDEYGRRHGSKAAGAHQSRGHSGKKGKSKH